MVYGKNSKYTTQQRGASCFTPTADPLAGTAREVTPSTTLALDQLHSEDMPACGRWQCVLPSDVTTLAQADCTDNGAPALCETMSCPEQTEQWVSVAQVKDQSRAAQRLLSRVIVSSPFPWLWFRLIVSGTVAISVFHSCT